MRFAGDHGHDSRCGGNCGEDRSASRQQPVRRGIGAVGVGADQAATVTRRAGRDRKSAVVEVAVHAHHDGVDRVGQRLTRVHHDLDTRTLQRLDHARPAGDEYPLAGLDECRDRHCGAHHVAGGVDADGPQRPFMIGERRRGIVGDEQHPTSRPAQRGHGVDRTGDRLVGEPHHAVEIAEHGVDGLGPVGHDVDRCSCGAGS